MFFLQWIYVVTFFECVSRPAKPSLRLHKWRAISRGPGNVKKKVSRNWGNLPEKCLPLPPPPANAVRWWRSRLLPPPTENWIRSASGDDGKCTGWHRPGGVIFFLRLFPGSGNFQLSRLAGLGYGLGLGFLGWDNHNRVPNSNPNLNHNSNRNLTLTPILTPNSSWS